MGNRNNRDWDKNRKPQPMNEAQRRMIEARTGKSFRGGQQNAPRGPHGPKPKVEIPSGGDFHNPFNFIRATDSIGGRSKHRSLKIYDGLSGVIHIKADVLTPLIIGGQRTPDTPGNVHHTVDFYEENGKRVIPSTSLKGMVRSAFEAVTNSCFLHFDPNTYEGYRKRPPMDPPIEIGIIRSLPTPNSDGEIELGDKFSIPYHQLESAGLRDYKDNPRKRPLPISCRLRAGGFATDEISQDINKLPVKGVYLKTSGKMRKKESETGFKPTGEHIPFYWKDRQRYISCMSHGDHADLKLGDIVYLQRKGNELISVGFAQIYKLPYKRSIVETMTKSQKPCTYEEKGEQNLCPACQVFGNIIQRFDPKSGRQDKSKVKAYAGRVFISNGEIEGQFNEKPIPLQVLGSPHTSCVGFYVRGKNLADGYDSQGATIRGRKVYPHHTPSYEYKDYPIKGMDPENKMNVSANGLLEKGFFTFNIRFDSLTPEELGALIYVLNCPDNHAVKLGMGKPLGLGSIRTIVTSLNLYNLKTRYSSLDNDGKSTVSPDGLSSYVQPFKARQSEIEKMDFEKIPYILDFNLATKLDLTGKIKVNYPRKKDRNGDPIGFQWFMEYTRGGEEPVQRLPELTEMGERNLKGWE